MNMENPITYSLREKKYMIWVSYWGIKIMKYFSTIEEAIDYIRTNSNRCMHLKKPVSNGILESWSLELNNNNISEIHNDDISSETVQKENHLRYGHTFLLSSYFLF
jgi:hypothetical protein